MPGVLNWHVLQVGMQRLLVPPQHPGLAQSEPEAQSASVVQEGSWQAA